MSPITTYRPSAAMIVALLALFVALGGGAYAATKLKPNSVKSKHVKDNSLKGVDINEATLDGSLIPGISAGGGAVADGAGTGPAGGDLAGNYPNPTIKNGAVSTAKIAPDTIAPRAFEADFGQSAEVALNAGELGGRAAELYALGPVLVQDRAIATGKGALNSELLVVGLGNPLGRLNVDCAANQMGVVYRNTSTDTQFVTVQAQKDGGALELQGQDVAPNGTIFLFTGLATDVFKGSILVDLGTGSGSEEAMDIEVGGYERATTCAFEATAITGVD